MPLYTYTCTRCGHTFEHLARTLSDKPSKCPACGAPKPTKNLSTFAVANARITSCQEPCPHAHHCSSGCGCHHP